MPFAAAIPALVALGQAGFQLYQGHKQKKMAENLKPSNYVPPSVKEAVASARLGANANAPGYGRFIENLKTSSANTVARASRISTNPAQIQQAVSDTDAREKEALKDMEVSNEGFKQQNQKYLASLLGVQGGYEKASMDAYNSAKSALTGASMQNKYNAITTLGENLIYSMGNKGLGMGNASIVGKKGDELRNGLAAIQKAGRTLTAEELAYIQQVGLKPDTLSLAFPSLKFTN